jgi:hypothetical protein
MVRHMKSDRHIALGQIFGLDNALLRGALLCA